MRSSPLKHQHSANDDPAETTPLLAGQLAPDGDTEASTLLGPSPPASIGPKSHKPLPKGQILLICYARMTEPIAFFSIFPFIAQMVQQNGHLPISDVGFYSGLIESLFSATQMVVLIFWGRLADRIGRKPVLIYSLIGTAVGPVLFGMSRTLWQMILFRCMAGVFSGSSLVLRTMVSELSTPETQARAFSWFAFAGNVGIFLGPILGGALADPVHQYPNAFKNLTFFADYPFALPGFVTGCICASSALLTTLFLKETLTKKISEDESIPVVPPMPTLELLKSPGVKMVLWVYGHVMFLAFAFTALLPVALYTPISLGGIGFSSFQISLYMAGQGASQAMWLLIVFPILQHRIGTKGVMKVCGIAYPWFFALYIVLNALLRDGSHAATVWFWIIGVIATLIGPGVSMAFTGAQLALNDVAPNSQVLGTLNALALTCSSGIRSVVPGAATAIYAIGVRNQILWGHLAWVLLIPLAAAYGVCCKYLPEGKPIHKDDEDEES